MKANGTTKICSKCNAEQPLEEYHKHAGRKDGLCEKCRTCCSAEGKAFRKRHPEKKAAQDKRYRAKHGDRIKAHHKLHKVRIATTQKAYKDKNRAKINAQAKEYRDANPALVKERNLKRDPEMLRRIAREFAHEHPERGRAGTMRRRARIKGASVEGCKVTHEQIAERWAMWGGKCWVCGKEAEATDHVKPLNKGGKHLACNLRPICNSCNSSKSDKWQPKELT